MEVTVRRAVAAEDGGEASEAAAVPDTIGVLIEEAEVGREAEGEWGKCHPDRAHTHTFSVSGVKGQRSHPGY